MAMCRLWQVVPRFSTDVSRELLFPLFRTKANLLAFTSWWSHELTNSLTDSLNLIIMLREAGLQLHWFDFRGCHKL
jgi:hypothetical protein